MDFEVLGEKYFEVESTKEFINQNEAKIKVEEVELYRINFEKEWRE